MIGTTLSSRYELVSELGRGGMGVVYRAIDPVLNREVAIKLIPPTALSPELETRFRSEAKFVAQMDHPAIVPIYDMGSHEGSLFFVMAIIKGTSLRPFLRDRSLSLGDALDIGIHVAEALDYSHSRGVIHRDIKPENIMVSREEGGGLRVRVMDFGLAKASTEPGITRTGSLLGSMGYLSPEQVVSKDVDPRSDIYSLGTVLYECVTGILPFTGELQSILYRIVHEAPQPPRSLGVDIDEELERIILSCLSKDPVQRPQKARDLATTLTQYRSRVPDSVRTRTVMIAGAVRPRASSPFVGREKELAELQGRLNMAVQGECHFAVVGGEQGIGKSRLLDEFENLGRARKIRVLHGKFVEQDRAFPYHGFCEAIQEFFRPGDASDSGHAAVDFSDLADDLISLFPTLSEVTEIRSAASGSRIGGDAGSRAPENRTEVFELLARTLARLSHGQPVVLLFEDLHAAEVSLEALQYIVRRLGPTPTFILGTYRSTEVGRGHPLAQMLASFQGDRRFLSITLGPLSPSEHRQLLERVVGGKKLADDLVSRLYEATEGNPFFTKELVRSLLESGGISSDTRGAWNLSGGAALSVESLPATIQQAVENRIERLPEELREVLFVASVIGKTFDFRDLEALAEVEGDLEDAVDRLVREGLIEEARKARGLRLAFSSGVVREVLYVGLPRRKRRSLHRKYGALLEQRHAGRLERVYPDLVYHFSEADVPEKTVEYGLKLARNLLSAFSPDEALRSAKAALEFLDEEWEGDRSIEGEARLLVAQAHRMLGDLDAAIRETDASIGIFRQEQRQPRLVEAILLAARTARLGRRAG